MKILTVSTNESNLRSEIWGWTSEDSDLYVRGKMIGYTPAPKWFYSYNTVLQALADGWRLLSPPEFGKENNCANWWLIKD